MRAASWLCLVLICAIPPSVLSQGRWTRQSPAPELRSVLFFDEQNGVAVGTTLESVWPPNGVILQTSDGGTSWTNRSVPALHQLSRVIQAGPAIAYAVGEGEILITTDKGVTWLRQDAGTTAALNGISITDGLNGTIVGAGTVLRTTDGGSLWTNISRGTINTICELAFVDSLLGLAVGDQGTILRTTDAGMTWHNMASPTGMSLNVLTWIDSMTALVIGSEWGWTGRRWQTTSHVLRSVDRGATWGLEHQWRESAAVDAKSPRAGTVFVVGNDLLERSTDGGRTWQSRMNGTTQTLASVAMIGRTTFVAALSGGGILRTTNGGATWSTLRRNGGPIVDEIASNGSGTLLAMAAGDRYFNQPCEIFRSSDSGATWTRLPDPPVGWGIQLTHQSSTGWMLLGGKAIGGGEVRTILRSTDDGENWNVLQSFPQSVRPEALAAPTLQRHVLVGRTIDTSELAIESGSILLTRNGGLMWDRVWQDQAARLAYVAFIDSSSGVAVGSTADDRTLILRTTDGGSSWNRLPSTGSGSLHLITMAANNGIILGTTNESGTPRPLVFATTDSGRTWTASTPSAGGLVEDVSLRDDGTGVIVGEFGNVWFTADGGRTMQTRSGLIRGNFRDISFFDSLRGMIVGAGFDTAGRSYNQVLQTSDGGVSWLATRILITGDLDKVAQLDTTRSIVVSSVYDPYSYRSTSQIFLTTDGGTSWTLQHTAQTTSLVSLATIDRQTVLVGGQAQQSRLSVLMRSTDGGTTWNDIALAQSIQINGIGRPGDSVLIVAGDGGVLLRSPDDGSTWTDHTGQLRQTFVDVWMTDPLNGVAIEEMTPGSSLLRTTDGGGTWNVAHADYSINLQRLSFASPDVGFAVGYVLISSDNRPGIALRTTNGGQSWANVNIVTDASLADVEFSGDRDGRIVGHLAEHTTSFRTTDQGSTWKEEPIGDFGYIADLASPTPDFSVGVGGPGGNWWRNGGPIIRTTDGGTTWSETYGTQSDLNDVVFSDPSNGLAVGSQGTILQTTNAGQSWQTRASPSLQTLRSVAMANEQHVTAVGDSGTILSSTDGGRHWIQQPRLTTYHVNSVSFAGGSRGLAVGDSGVVFQTTDGGATWIPNDSLLGYSLTEVDHASPAVAIAVGYERGWSWESDTSVILRTTDGGSSWSPIFLMPTNDRITAVQFATEQVGYMALTSWPSLLLRTTDQGLTWDSLINQEDLYASIEDIYALDERTLTIVGTTYGFHCEMGFIATSTDGGETWLRETGQCGRFIQHDPGLLNIWESFLAVHFSDRTTGTVVGYGGAIFRTSDGGATWSEGTREPDIPATTELSQNFPNPFNPETKIGFRMKERGWVKVAVYDLLGREVAVLVDEEKAAGTYSVEFRAQHSGFRLSSGVYFYTMRVGTFVQTRRMLLIK